MRRACLLASSACSAPKKLPGFRSLLSGNINIKYIMLMIVYIYKIISNINSNSLLSCVLVSCFSGCPSLASAWELRRIAKRSEVVPRCSPTARAKPGAGGSR